MKRIKLAILVIACIALLVFVESQTKILRHTVDNVLYDNYNHYLPCTALPTEVQAMDVLSAHQDSVDAILAIDPGNIGIEMDTATCPGKADVLIWYPSHRDRLAIEELLQGTSFYGVPLRLQNR